ncbi:hypothetical protein [Vulcanisaeta distributa]|uniref:hypothetical protein n=1 Tax=Vulcanisaeta distributa TaxID=164451 RepID=UPI001FB2358A|nr:hypothetical protein [Vulcanisaeta distributa]
MPGKVRIAMLLHGDRQCRTYVAAAYIEIVKSKNRQSLKILLAPLRVSKLPYCGDDFITTMQRVWSHESMLN